MSDINDNNEIPESILREFRPIIYNIVGYLKGIHNLPAEYSDNIELQAKIDDGNLKVESIYYWMDVRPTEGFISRTEENKKILYNGDNYHIPSYYLEILNFMLNLLSPKIGTYEEEILYEKYFIGRRLYVYGINDTTRNYYWYGDRERLIEDNDLDITNTLSNSDDDIELPE